MSCESTTSSRVSSSQLIDWQGTLLDARRHPRAMLKRAAALAKNAVAGNVVCVPTRLCTNGHAFSFGDPTGWHHLVDLARELLQRPDAALEETAYHHFLREISAPSLTDMLTFHDPQLRASLPRLPYGSYPWGPYEWYHVDLDPNGFYDRSVKSRRTASCPSTQPGFTEFLFYEKSLEVEEVRKRHFSKIDKLVRSFRDSGYRPLLGRSLLPTAGRLVAESGEERFLVKDGNHRLSVLVAFGCERVWLRLDQRRFPPVLESEIPRWPWVRSGLLRDEDARRVFRLYFELNGSERARALGIPGVEMSGRGPRPGQSLMASKGG